MNYIYILYIYIYIYIYIYTHTQYIDIYKESGRQGKMLTMIIADGYNYG